MLGSILVFWVFQEARSAVWDPDIWFHIRNVEFLLANGRTPSVDTYSYTTHGYLWLNHQWLAEIPYYYVWRAGGLVGIFLFFTILLVLIHFGMYMRAYRQSGNMKASFLVCSLSVLLTCVSFGPRTLLFGYSYLLILIFLLDRHRATGKTAYWAFPPLFCLWINCHGTWPLGFVLIGIYIVSGLAEGRWGQVESSRWSWPEIRPLLITSGISFAALFVNPFTYRLVLYPYEMAVHQKLNVASTDEWASVNFHDPRGKVVLALLAAMFLGILLSRYRWKLEEVLLAGFALYSGLMHIRFLFLVAVLLTPLFAKMLQSIPPYQPEIDKPWLNAAVIGLLLVILIYRVPSQGDLSQGLAKRFPAQALAFAKVQGLQGNFFNRYMWGGYMIYYNRDLKTFIDGRADIFEYSGVMKDYLDTESIQRPYEVFDKYQVQYALVPPDGPLAYLLKCDPGWKVLYTDDVAAIIARQSPAQAASPLPPPAPRIRGR